jgi:hypothetical protein
LGAQNPAAPHPRRVQTPNQIKNSQTSIAMATASPAAMA